MTTEQTTLLKAVGLDLLELKTELEMNAHGINGLVSLAKSDKKELFELLGIDFLSTSFNQLHNIIRHLDEMAEVLLNVDEVEA